MAPWVIIRQCQLPIYPRRATLTSNSAEIVQQVQQDFPALVVYVTGAEARGQTVDTVEVTLFRRLRAPSTSSGNKRGSAARAPTSASRRLSWSDGATVWCHRRHGAQARRWRAVGGTAKPESPQPPPQRGDAPGEARPRLALNAVSGLASWEGRRRVLNLSTAIGPARMMVSRAKAHSARVRCRDPPVQVRTAS